MLGRMLGLLTRRSLSVMLLLGAQWVLPGCTQPRHRIALLMGSSWTHEETLIDNDVSSFRPALQKRGFEASQIKVPPEKLNRGAVLDAIRAIASAARLV